jgi:hypothetical protein
MTRCNGSRDHSVTVTREQNVACREEKRREEKDLLADVGGGGGG